MNYWERDKGIILGGVGKEKTKLWAKNTVQVYYNASVPYLNIDRGVYPLVVILNRHPKIWTTSSCEGHPNLFNKYLKSAWRNVEWRQWFFSVQREVYCEVEKDFQDDFEKICKDIINIFREKHTLPQISISQQLETDHYCFELWSGGILNEKVRPYKEVEKELNSGTHLLCNELSKRLNVSYEKHLQNFLKV